MRAMYYLICATPRVGSNFLCDLLLKTKVAGRAKEFLCPTQVTALGGEYCGYRNLAEGAADINRYFERMQEEFCTGDVFGAKVHFKQFQWALEQGFELTRHFPHRFFYITRDDIVGQAISYLRASQTNKWIHDHEKTGEPQFHAPSLLAVVRELVSEYRGWESFFETLNVEPYRISYERLCKDLKGELSEILRFIDLDPAEIDVDGAVAAATERFKVQRDDISCEWRARYTEFLHQRAREQSRVMSAPLSPVS